MSFKVIKATIQKLPTTASMRQTTSVVLEFPNSDEAVRFGADPVTKSKTIQCFYDVGSSYTYDPVVNELNILLIKHGYEPFETTFQTWLVAPDVVFFRAPVDTKMYHSLGVSVDVKEGLPPNVIYEATLTFSSVEAVQQLQLGERTVYTMTYGEPKDGIPCQEIIGIKQALVENGYEMVGNYKQFRFSAFGFKVGDMYLRAPAPEPKKRTFFRMLKGA